MESIRAARALLTLLGGYPDLPGPVGYGYLEADGPGLSLSPAGAGRTVRYIAGGFRRELPFALTVRVQPSGDDDRLAAGALLEDMAAWAEDHAGDPPLDGGGRWSLQAAGAAALVQRRPDGCEDHQIQLIMSYEVI